MLKKIQSSRCTPEQFDEANSGTFNVEQIPPSARNQIGLNKQLLTCLEAVEILNCHECGKDLAWDMVAFSRQILAQSIEEE